MWHTGFSSSQQQSGQEQEQGQGQRQRQRQRQVERRFDRLRAIQCIRQKDKYLHVTAGGGIVLGNRKLSPIHGFTLNNSGQLTLRNPNDDARDGHLIVTVKHLAGSVRETIDGAKVHFGQSKKPDVEIKVLCLLANEARYHNKYRFVVHTLGEWWQTGEDGMTRLGYSVAELHKQHSPFALTRKGNQVVLKVQDDQDQNQLWQILWPKNGADADTDDDSTMDDVDSDNDHDVELDPATSSGSSLSQKKKKVNSTKKKKKMMQNRSSKKRTRTPLSNGNDDNNDDTTKKKLSSDKKPRRNAAESVQAASTSSSRVTRNNGRAVRGSSRSPSPSRDPSPLRARSPSSPSSSSPVIAASASPRSPRRDHRPLSSSARMSRPAAAAFAAASSDSDAHIQARRFIAPFIEDEMEKAVQERRESETPLMFLKKTTKPPVSLVGQRDLMVKCVGQKAFKMVYIRRNEISEALSEFLETHFDEMGKRAVTTDTLVELAKVSLEAVWSMYYFLFVEEGSPFELSSNHLTGFQRACRELCPSVQFH